MRTLLLLLACTCAHLLPAQLVGDRQNGLASYYSTEYDGAETAYGVVYDREELVAAHKTYPYNSRVRVVNQENGKAVTVRIIDKGPFIRGRVIELSERAAALIGMLGQRTVPVELTLLSTPEQRPLVEEAEVRPAPPRPAPNPTFSTPPEVEPEEAVTTPSPTSVSVPPRQPPAAEPTPTPPPTPPTPRRAPPVSFTEGLYRISVGSADGGGYAVQVGSYANLSSAMDKVVDLQARYFDDILVQKLPTAGNGQYKVLLGPFSDRASAVNYAGDLQQRYGIAGFTVALPR